jgi:hypothetical protein
VAVQWGAISLNTPPPLAAKRHLPNRDVLFSPLSNSKPTTNTLVLKLFRMARKELSPQLRSRICELSSIHWSARRIHEKHPDIPISTIRTTIRRQASRDDNKPLPRSGRPQSLTEEQRNHVYDVVNHTNPHIKMRDLLREVNDACKKRCL